MAMAEPMPMNTGTAPIATDADLLVMAQWLSPAFPVGAFAYSHGLEQAVAQGWVRNGAELADWLHDLLRCGSLGAEAVILSAAYASPRAAWPALNAECRAFAASAERCIEADRQGHAFTQTVNAVWALTLPEGLILPVALGAAARQRGLRISAPSAFAAISRRCSMKPCNRGFLQHDHVERTVAHWHWRAGRGWKNHPDRAAG